MWGWRVVRFPDPLVKLGNLTRWRGVINHVSAPFLLTSVVAGVGNVIMAPLDPPPHNAHLVRHTMQGEAGLNPAP